MAKFKSNMLNKLAEKQLSTKAVQRARQSITVYLNRKNFEIFKDTIAPLSPSEVFDAYISETIGVEKKKEK
jgi:hypothetical protein